MIGGPVQWWNAEPALTDQTRLRCLVAAAQIHANPVRIYALLDPFSGQARYVGKTTGTLRSRLIGHIGDVKRGRVFIPRHKWIASILAQSGSPEIFELETCDRSDWQECEKFWIAYLRFIGCDLLNATSGGDGLCHYRHKDETKARQREAALRRYSKPGSREETGAAVRRAFQREDAYANLMTASALRTRDPSGLIAYSKSEAGRARKSEISKGRKLSEAVKAKISAARLGQKMPDGFGARQAAYRLGKKHSPETIEKMRQSFARRMAEKQK